MPFDLSQAAPPELIALQRSHTHDSVEADIKRLALDLFRDHLGERAFDANVLGMAHLGSFDLVRRFIQADGLGMLRSDREEAAVRYLYRAWKASDTQGRGLHFLRTYLQLLFPGEAEVQQLWHAKDQPYGTAWRSGQSRYLIYHFLGQSGVRLDGSWQLGRSLVPLGELPPLYTPDPSGIFLTSRIEILLSLELATRPEYQVPGGGYVFAPLLEIIRAIIPARLVPAFRFWLRFVLSVPVQLSGRLHLFKDVDLRYPWCGRVISEAASARWSLGIDPQYVRLPQPFGTFRVGEKRGSPLTWRLRPCRITGVQLGEKRLDLEAYDLMPRAGEPWRRLDGRWALGRRRRHELLSLAQLDQRAAIAAGAQVQAAFGESIRLDYPFTPKRIGRMLRLDGRWRLGTGHTLWRSYRPLNGTWALKPGERFWAGKGPPLDGRWTLGRAPSIGVDASFQGRADIALLGRAPTLGRAYSRRIHRRPRPLDGSWTLKALHRLGQFRLDGRTALKTRKMTQSQVLGQFKLMCNEAGRAWPIYDETAVWRDQPVLNGAWRVGASPPRASASLIIIKR